MASRSKNFTDEQLVEEYGVDMAVVEYANEGGYKIKVGDRVKPVDDPDLEDEMEIEGIYAGDEGDRGRLQRARGDVAR